MPKDKIMEEIKKSLKELAESQKKTDEQIKALTEKTDKEIERLSKEIEKVNKETDKEIEKVSKEIEKVNKETDKEIEKVSKEIEKVNKMVGDLTDGWGKFVVGLTEPSISDEIEKLGFKVLSVDSPQLRRLNGRELEVDLLIITKFNGKPKIIVIEVKSSINQKKVDKFIKTLTQFKSFFIEYKNIDVIGGIAGVRFARGTKELVLQQGLYLFSTSKGIMKSLTPMGFKPKGW